jgi:hypothetical protein
MGNYCVNPQADALSDSHKFRYSYLPFVLQRCALCREFLVLLESLDRLFLFVACNTSKSTASVV